MQVLRKSRRERTPKFWKIGLAMGTLLFCLGAAILLYGWGLWKGVLDPISQEVFALFRVSDGDPLTLARHMMSIGAAAAIAAIVFNVMIKVMIWWNYE